MPKRKITRVRQPRPSYRICGRCKGDGFIGDRLCKRCDGWGRLEDTNWRPFLILLIIALAIVVLVILSQGNSE